MESETLSFIFNNVTKGKQVYSKERVKALRYEDFLEAIIKICILGKHKLGVPVQREEIEAHDPPTELFELEGVTTETIETFLSLLGLVAGEKKGPIVQILKKLKQQNRMEIVNKGQQAKHEVGKNEEAIPREDNKLEVCIKSKDNNHKLPAKINKQKPIKTEQKHDDKRGRKLEIYNKSHESNVEQVSKEEVRKVNELQDSREELIPIDTSNKLKSVKDLDEEGNDDKKAIDARSDVKNEQRSSVVDENNKKSLNNYKKNGDKEDSVNVKDNNLDINGSKDLDDNLDVGNNNGMDIYIEDKANELGN